jgi:PAS domain S-box-containing protein
MRGETRKILLVEDEAIIALGTTRMLKERGYEVACVPDGETAVARVDAEAQGIDLILMDINLGRGITGPEAAQRILKNHEMPIVFLSSHTEKAIVESTEEISSYGYVVKNSGITVLDASIKMAFRLFEARKSIHAKNMAIEAANEQLRVSIGELTEAYSKVVLSEDKFLKAFRLSPDAITISDLTDGHYLDVNIGFTEILGYSREEAIGRSSLPDDLGIWVHAEEREALLRCLRESGEVTNIEAEFRRKDGSVAIGMLSSKIIEIDGRDCLLTITRDITDRKIADELIKDSESRFRAAFANAPVGMALLSITGDLRMMNQSFAAMLGYSMLEANSVDFSSFLHPEELPASEEAGRSLLKGEKETIRLVQRYLHKDGRVVWVDESVSLLHGKDSEFQGFIIHALDVSKRKLAEDKAVKLDRVRSVVSEAMQLIIREPDLHELLEGICRIVVEKGEMSFAWIGLADDSPSGIRPFASPGDANGFFDAFSISQDKDNEDLGTSRIALREGRITLCNDIGTDPRMAPWRERALQAGYRSVASFPLHSGSKIIGVFSVCAGEIGYFGEEETGLLAQLALDISFELESLKNEEGRRRTEDRLRESEELYRASFMQSSAVKLHIDPATDEIVDANFAAADFYGYPISKLTAMKVTDLNPAPKDLVQKSIALAQDRSQSHFYFRHRLASGELREVEVFSSPIRIGGRTLLHSIIHDITDQKRAERALRDSEKRFKSFVENASDLIFTLDAEGAFTYVSPNWKNVLGHEPGEVLGRSLTDFMHPDDAQPCSAYLKRVIEDDDTPGTIEFRALNKAGEWRWHSANGSRIVDEPSGTVAFIGISRDVTERKLFEERLERLVLEKETLMKELQHRVKNSLGVVKSLLDLEMEECGEPAKKVLSDAGARIQSIAAIYERLYLSEDPASVNMALYIDDLAASIFSTYSIDPKRVTLRILVEAVFMDTKRSVPLGLIINELLSNALKYAYRADEKGEVRVEFRREGDAILLAVSDDGAGIPDEYLSPECQSMGMALVRLLAAQIKGEVDMDNHGGTRVRIRFQE